MGSQLAKALQELQISYTNRQLDQCNQYLQELHIWNKKMNLSGASSVEELESHIIDSLLGKPIIDGLAPQQAVDLGSGAGFPAIPLAIFNSSTSWTLVERSHRRCGFLRVVVALLGLKEQVSVVEQPAEELVESVDLVTFRAFRPVEAMHATFQEYLNHGATLVMYKGKRSALEEELSKNPLGEQCTVYSVSHRLVRGERSICVIS